MFSQVFVVTGHELLLTEIVHSISSKSMTEGFPEPHSRNYSCRCALGLEFQNNIHTEIIAVGITDAAKNYIILI